MPIEIELKYYIESNKISEFLGLPFLQNIPHKTQKLYSVYYDTKDFQLLKNDYVLRIRKKLDNYIQTVKRSGKTADGLHERPEWEWLLPNEQIDKSLFPEPDFLNNLTLHPIFITDFERKVWLITQKNNSFELCLDQGLVYVPETNNTLPISEIELELLSGTVANLCAVGAQLQTQLALRQENVSKAERGFSLLAK